MAIRNIGNLERLMRLKQRGDITEAEYKAKKDLLMEGVREEAEAEKRIFPEEWVDYKPKRRAVFVVFALLFVGLGFHNFYAGYWIRGLIQFLMTICSGGYLMIISYAWAAFEVIYIKEDAKGVGFN